MSRSRQCSPEGSSSDCHAYRIAFALILFSGITLAARNGVLRASLRTRVCIALAIVFRMMRSRISSNAQLFLRPHCWSRSSETWSVRAHFESGMSASQGTHAGLSHQMGEMRDQSTLKTNSAAAPTGRRQIWYRGVTSVLAPQCIVGGIMGALWLEPFLGVIRALLLQKVRRRGCARTSVFCSSGVSSGATPAAAVLPEKGITIGRLARTAH